jgi:hypothetical protein
MDAIEAASTPGLYWLLCGGIELYVGAEEKTLQGHIKRSKVSSRPHAEDFFRSSTAALRALLR